MHKLEAIKARNLHPVAQLEERIHLVEDRMNDAQDIFHRKFNLIHDQVQSMVEKIEEDKQVQAEINFLRQQELEQLKTETDKFFT